MNGSTYRQRHQNNVLRYAALGVIGVLFVTSVLCSGLYGVLMVGLAGVGPVMLATILALITAVPYAIFLLWLDHNEPEPISLIIMAFLWGACSSTMFSLVVNSSFGAITYSVTGDAGLSDQLTASISAPLFEELSKGVAVLFLFALFRSEFDNVMDGIIYGAFIGLGFAWYENILYYVNTSVDNGVPGMLAVFWIRGVVSASGGSHAAYTALVGCGFGLVRVIRHGGLRWLLIPAFWGLAIFAHFAWNTFTQYILLMLTPDHLLGQLLIGFPIAVVILQAPFTFLLFVTVFFSWRHENKIIRKYLSGMPMDIITEEELSQLVPARRRMVRNGFRLLTRGPIEWWNHRKLARRQVDLAFLRWHHEADGIEWNPAQDVDIMKIESDIRTLRKNMSL